MSDAASIPSPTLHPRRTKWFALGALAVAGVAFAIITVGGIGRNLVYYWGPTELHEAGDKAVGATIRLGGLVAPGSVARGDGISGAGSGHADQSVSVELATAAVAPSEELHEFGD